MIRRLASIGLGLLLSGSAFAQDTHLGDALLPQVGQRGTTVELVAIGAFLNEPQEVLFYQPGIRCTGFEVLTRDIPGTWSLNNDRTGESPPGKTLKMTFVIAKNAPLGEHQLRIRTRDGFGELLRFWVSPFPVVMEEHPFADTEEARNDSIEHAQTIPLNCTVAGFMPLPLSQDHDFYRVDCEKGQRLSVEVVASRLGTLHYGGMNDPAIRIYDARGKEIARNDDNSLFAQDPFISIIVPEAGAYYIDMHQQMDYENRRRHYAMHVGTFPRPALAWPLGGRAGEEVDFTLLGPGEEKRSKRVRLPSEPGLFEKSTFGLFAGENGAPLPPSPNRVQVAPFGNVFEKGHHNKPEAAQEIGESLPLTINGKIETEGEVDWYRFAAKKGERYRVRAYAKTLNSELDAKVWIRPAEGNPDQRSYEEDDSGWEAHDWVGHSYRWQIQDRLDPIFMFEPEEDGDYLLGIADTRRQFGPHHLYRVEFQPHIDGVFVHFPAYPSTPLIVRDRITVFRGNTYARPVGVQNGFGSRYEGALHLRALNLPKGVTMEAPAFTKNDPVIPVLFNAAPDSQPGAHLIDLVVEPVEPADRKNFRGGYVQVTQATNRRGDYAMVFNKTRRMALAVVEGDPFHLEIEQPEVALVQNGELALRVKAKRHQGFDGAIYCEIDWLPNGVNKQPPLIIPKGESEAEYRINARSDAAPGTYPVSITGRENQVEGGSVRSAAGFHYAGSPFVDLTVAEPYLDVTLERAAIERGTTGEIRGTIKHRKPFTGDAIATLGRLPFGVKQVEPFPRVKAGDESVTFKVEVTKDCLVEQYKDIYCEVAIPVEGQVIRQQTGNGILRVDVERK